MQTKKEKSATRRVWYARSRGANSPMFKKYREYQYNKSKERYAATKLWLSEYKGARGCSRCNEVDPICLDFHHLDPTIKDGMISTMMTCSQKRILDEISKCIILCANCHRKEHHKVV